MSTYCECGHVYGCHVASYFHADSCRCAECAGKAKEQTGPCLDRDGCDCADFTEAAIEE